MCKQNDLESEKLKSEVLELGREVKRLNEVIEWLKPLAEKEMVRREGKQDKEDEQWWKAVSAYRWAKNYRAEHPDYTNDVIYDDFKEQHKEPFPRKGVAKYCEEEGIENPLKRHKSKKS